MTASARANVPPRLCPTIETFSPVCSAKPSSRASSRPHACSEHATLERMPARRVRYPTERSQCVIVPRDPSPAMKPGISITGRPPPPGTPSPRSTGLRCSAASSSAKRDSFHSGGMCGGCGIREKCSEKRADPSIDAVLPLLGGAAYLPIRQSARMLTVRIVQQSARNPRGAPKCKDRAMRATTIRDGRIFVEEHPDPVPQAGELLVRVKAAGLNGADMLQLAGRYPPPPGRAGRHPGPRARRRGGRLRPRRRPLRARRPRDGGGRRRRPGRARGRARVDCDAGAGRARLDRGRRRARGVHDRPRRAVHAGRPDARASGCSSTARRAASAWRPCSSA